MAWSLGLAAYRALSGRKDAPDATASVPRPATGALVWIHAAETGNLIAVYDLALRLCAGGVGLNVLITGPDAPGARFPAHPVHTIVFQPTPAEHPDVVRAFLDHWQPDFCLWTWGALRPNLVLETATRGCQMMLIDADTKGFDGRRDRWMPDMTKDVLRAFSMIFARTSKAKRRLENFGVSQSRLKLTAPLQAGGQALPCADSDLADISQALGTRPIWFAAKVQPDEVPTLLRAHRAASRLSHRLLLILNPADPAQATAVVAQSRAAHFDTIHWEESAGPDDTTQVMVVEDSRDRGLFFRIAPVSFLGSSLVDAPDACDPFEAAALGSAILYGPKVGAFMPSYSGLAAEGAARIVNDGAALGVAVTRLIAPDQAATMAHAGWNVISTGAELTDRIVDMVQDALDHAAAQGKTV